MAAIRWHRVRKGRPEQLAEGALLGVRVGGRAVCIVRHQGRLHALLDRCPHQGSSFIGGWCEDACVVCPVHQMGFDLRTGRNRAGGAETAVVYPVQERADGVYIGIPRRGLRLFGFRWGGGPDR
ncbi:MAG: Rieske 2Fe-2S domain-containing protein [Bacteroidetes bacterium]|nr:Rieske 2Fe-2S domain-containing protein [Bacteroidota bacterium]